MKCVICLNGDPPEKALLDQYTKDSFVIVADGACGFFRSYNMFADLIVGDFDSYRFDMAQKVLKPGGTVVKHNIEKDYTDGQLALSEALSRGYKDIVLLGALGGRMDHSLENIRLLYNTDDNIKISAKCNDCEMFIVKRRVTVCSDEPCTVSIIPYTDEMQIEKTSGFKYSADGLTLTRLDSTAHSGLSNVLVSNKGEICVKRGAALVIVYNRLY